MVIFSESKKKNEDASSSICSDNKTEYIILSVNIIYGTLSAFV